VRELYGDKVADLVKITRNPDGTVKSADPLPQRVQDPFGGKPLEGPDGVLEYERHYYRLLSSVDDNMGRLFDALETKGILDDTPIIFTSDNGYFHGEGSKKRCAKLQISTASSNISNISLTTTSWR